MAQIVGTVFRFGGPKVHYNGGGPRWSHDIWAWQAAQATFGTSFVDRRYASVADDQVRNYTPAWTQQESWDQSSLDPQRCIDMTKTCHIDLVIGCPYR
jgi:hypothetical protein